MRVDVVNRSAQPIKTADVLGGIKKACALIKTRPVRNKISNGTRSGIPALEEISIVFVRDSESMRLNRRYRKKNHPANVLSFRYDGSGEIIIAPGLLRRQAGQAHDFAFELRRVAIHGLLHLLGYHHEDSVRQAIKFEKLEQKILKHLKLI